MATAAENPIRIPALVLALVAVLLGGPAVAQAASVSVSGGTLSYIGGNDPNQLTVSSTGSTVQLSEASVTLTAGSGCTGANTAVTCTGVTAMVLNAGDGNNTVKSTSALDTDVIAGTGIDRLYTGAGADSLTAGDGDDWLDGGLGLDVFTGGAGTSDVVLYTGHQQAVSVDLAGDQDDGAPGENDMVKTDVEHIVGGAGNDTLTGNAGQNFLSGGPGNDTILGGGGTGDYVSYWERSDPVTIDFASNTFGNVATGENDIVDSAILNGIGGTGNDRLIGDAAANTLWGGWSGVTADGDDWIQGGGGADVVRGDQGADTVDYSDKSVAVGITFDGVANDGTAGESDNVQTDVENATGGSGSDTLTGNGSANVLDGGLGNDTLTGGAGTDTLSYASHTLPVTASLGAGADGQAGETDTVAADFEHLTGGQGADTLSGDGAPNALRGGPGTDTVTYAARSASVTADADGVADDGAASENDNIAADVENLTGGSAADTLTGGDGANVLTGAGGNDTLAGGLGPDILDGGADDDTFHARDGALDALVCAGGADGGSADIDDTLEGCESVERPSLPEPDTTPPVDPVSPPVGEDPPGTGDGKNEKDGLTGPINLEPPIVPTQVANVTGKGVAQVQVVCPLDAGACKGTVDLYLYEPARAGKARGKVTASRRRKLHRIGRAKFAAKAGKKPVVAIRLDRRGRRRVLRGRRTRCRVVVTTRTATGKTHQTVKDITLRARRGGAGRGRRARNA